ncbi:hypothetical protein [Paraburkholderia terricola]|uniref:hypothetical protein n=1 Tax=Paraburkholderia terricola TaxID=169427 RepID=UPI001FC7D465|nr:MULTISPECIES: hypothetical protein [Paraburkholderia]
MDNELTPVDSELAVVEVEVDNDDTLLFVVDSPVDRKPTPVLKDAMPLAAVDKPVEVETLSELTLLFVVDRPVLSDEMPVDAEVERAFTARFVALSCEPLMASVLVALMRPAATFVI